MEGGVSDVGGFEQGVFGDVQLAGRGGSRFLLFIGVCVCARVRMRMKPT